MYDFFFISCEFDLIMNGDFRPLFCPWNVFFSQLSKPSTIRSHFQINAYLITFDTHKALLGTRRLFFSLP
jgi:hypothetical protein